MAHWIIVGVIIVALLAFIIGSYNRIIALIEAVKNDQKQIDIQLDRRFKVFESLISVVKKYMDHEKSTLKDVIALRSQAQQAQETGDTGARMTAENKISQIASGINVVFERYPDLKADKNAMALQEEIVSTENKLAFSKQSFNDSVERYNAYKLSFFASMIVSFFKKKLDFNFPYWQLDKAAVKEKEDYSVKF